MGLIDSGFQLLGNFSRMQFAGIGSTVGGGDVAHDGHQFALNGKNELSILFITVKHRAHHAQVGIQLVNLAIGLDAHVIFRNAHTVP